MHFCTSFIRRTIWTIGLMLWGIVYCHAYHFKSTSAYRSTSTEYRQSTGFNAPNGGGRIADFPTPITATFKGGHLQSANRLIGDGVNIYEAGQSVKVGLGLADVMSYDAAAQAE